MKIVSTPRFGIVQKFIMTAALFMMTLIWPAGLFPVSQSSQGSVEDAVLSNPSTSESFFRQEFSLMFENPDSIAVYISNDPESMDTLLAAFRIYNTSGICLQESKFQVEEYELPGYVTIPVTVDLQAETKYFFTIEGLDGQLFSVYCNEETKTPELGQLLYKEVPTGGRFLGVRFDYTRPMGVKRIALSYTVIALLAATLILGVANIRNRLKKEVWEKVEKYTKVVLIAGSIVTAGFCLFHIIFMKRFSADLTNILVLSAGVILAAAVLIFLIMRCPSEYLELSEKELTKKQNALAFLRGVLWALVIIETCRNHNAMTDYEKGLYLREMITFFGILMVLYSSKKEIFNIPNLVFSLVSVGVGYWYVSINSDHIEHINTAVRTSFAVWSLGLIVINFVYAALNKKFGRLKQISIPYAVLVVAFWILCVVFADGREWPGTVLLLFTIWIIKYLLSDDKAVILQDICNGILFALVGTVIFCLYRRAYQYYILMRYAGIYFTVTATAIYLCVPAAAAFAKIIDIRTVTWKKRIPELIVLGMVGSYMLFTISRTGLITVAVVGGFALFLPFRDKIKGFAQKQIKNMGVIFTTFLLCVIMFFSLTRMVPAVVSNPFYFFLEKDWKFVSSETEMDGPEYITVQRFGEMVTKRILGLGGIYDTVEETEEEQSVDQTVELQANVEESDMIEETVETTDAQNTDSAPELEEQEVVSDYSNGRLDIYRTYLANLKMTGHPQMGITQGDETIMHAHNTYIQTAYDFGIPMGILMMIVCLVTFIRSCMLAYHQGSKDKYTCLPMLIVVAFGVAAVFELVYLPSIPLGIAFLLMIAPLMIKKSEWEKAF